MPYYGAPNARGDYYRGDFWSKLGKGIKRVVKVAAPIVGAAVPFVGGATLIGRAYSASKRVKAAGRAIRRVNPAEAQLAQMGLSTATSAATGAGFPAPVFAAAAASGSAPARRKRRRRRRASSSSSTQTRRRRSRRRTKRRASR